MGEVRPKTIEEVTDWVKDQHDSIKQKRVDGSPYWEHIIRVAGIVSEYYRDDDDHDTVVKAALSHDWIEDVNPEGHKDLVKIIGFDSAILVIAVTNKYTKDKYPKLNRSERKVLEAERLGRISFEAMIIKLADIIDNLSDIEKAKPKMALTYKKEKRKVLNEMSKTTPHIMSTNLYKQAKLLTE